MKILKFLLLLVLFSCSSDNARKLKMTMRVLAANDTPLLLPQPGDWLYEHKEKGQTFSEYIKSTPLTISAERKIIFLQPLGNFSPEQKNIIQYTAEYLEIFFGLEVRISPIIDNSIVPDTARRIGREGNEQLLASYILNNVLMKRVPDNAIVYMALTEKDLYPKPSWNFVFGLASYRSRVGVTSIFRFSDYALDSTNYKLCLGRLIKISSHEIGHMFSMKHCTYALCTMNGTNSISETDSKPNRFCSQCTGKLIWNLKVDQANRLKKLREFFIKHKLEDDLDKLNADFKLLEAKKLFKEQMI